MKQEDLLDQARAMIRAEAKAVARMADALDESFAQTVTLVEACKGNIFVSGSGTSGTMARRMVHLLCSCGIAAFFMDPATALHGPSAIIAPGDLVIALSKSGKSEEVNSFVSIARRRGAKVIGWTWAPDSPLAQLSDHVVNVHSGTDGEGEGVFPFGSTLAVGAVGDAICLLVRRKRGIELKELTETHPSGGTAELVR
jgi:arabinose-5-phosphate isomerase